MASMTVNKQNALTSSDEATVARLARNKSTQVRRAAAGNPHCPDWALSVLANERDEGIRLRVGANPSTDTATLRRLAGDRLDAVVTAVAGNVWTPEDVLDQLCDHDSGRVRLALANNVMAPTWVLRRLACDSWSSKVKVQARTALIARTDTLDDTARHVALGLLDDWGGTFDDLLACACNVAKVGT
jgi:hypothetical protein